MSVLSARGLGKRFGAVQAVRDLSFAVERGSVFGLLGKNGAGKTTTIQLLLGLLRPDAGSSSILGEDSLALSQAVRRRVGYLSESGFEFDDLPLPYLVRYYAAFFERWDWDYTNELARRLAVPQDRPLNVLSVGERRKCELLLVLAQKPDLLILDDPALGLDTTVRREFLWAALDAAREQGSAVLFTSHVLTDVERVVDTVGLMQDGTMRLVAPLDDLKERTKRLILPADADAGPIPGECTRSHSGREVAIVTTAFTPELLDRLRQRAGFVGVEDMNLEDIFCDLVGGGPARANAETVS